MLIDVNCLKQKIKAINLMIIIKGKNLKTNSRLQTQLCKNNCKISFLYKDI